MPTCNISDSDVPHTRGAAGIGLVRTETAILYDQSDEVQTTRLRELLKSAEGVPVLLRTCDTRADDDAPVGRGDAGPPARQPAVQAADPGAAARRHGRRPAGRVPDDKRCGRLGSLR